MTTPFEAAIEAVRARDPDALELALPDVELAQRFRDEALPELEPSDCRWFWTATLSPEQFTKVAGMVLDVASTVARKQGLVLGTDYSQTVDETGLGQLLCTEMTFSRIVAELPVERRSMLRALLRVLPG